MDAILQVENLTKHYPDFTLDHVSFSVPKGTIMGLIGENGAGKSTTINAILDLIHKDDGTVTFWGQELSSAKQLKEDIGVVFDGINFYETLTPAKVGKIARAAYSQWDNHLYQDYLKRFQLPLDKEFKQMSKGMKVKLCIAVALSHNPKLLILDEATSGLDPVMRDDILDVFLEFVQDENHSIMMSSHITTDLEKVADYITFIHQGKVIFNKKKDDLRYHYGIVRELVGHGVGTKLHEDPQIPNYQQKRRGPKLRPGMTLAVEPMINMGRGDVEWLEDNWTVVTQDGSLSAHYENTILITEGEPEILTV